MNDLVLQFSLFSRRIRGHFRVDKAECLAIKAGLGSLPWKVDHTKFFMNLSSGSSCHLISRMWESSGPCVSLLCLFDCS